jgi:hypothetical protein
MAWGTVQTLKPAGESLMLLFAVGPRDVRPH